MADSVVRMTVKKQPGGRGPWRWHYAVDWLVDPDEDIWAGFGGWCHTKTEAKTGAKTTAMTLSPEARRG